MDTLKSRALASSRPVHFGAKFICATSENEYIEVDSVGREPKLSIPSLPTILSVSESFLDVKLSTHGVNEHNKTNTPHEDDRKSRHKN